MPVPKGKKQGERSNKDANKKLKWETARELGLDDDLTNPGDELTVREAGRIGQHGQKAGQGRKETLDGGA